MQNQNRLSFAARSVMHTCLRFSRDATVYPLAKNVETARRSCFRPAFSCSRFVRDSQGNAARHSPGEALHPSHSCQPPPCRPMENALTIILPVFNEDESLPAFFREMDRFLGAAPLPARVLFVNDGSTDRSPLLLRQYCAARTTLAVRQKACPERGTPDPGRQSLVGSLSPAFSAWSAIAPMVSASRITSSASFAKASLE